MALSYGGLVGKNSSAAGSAFSVTVAAAVTVPIGGLIVVHVSIDDETASPSVTDNAGLGTNAYTLAGSDVSGTHGHFVFKCRAAEAVTTGDLISIDLGIFSAAAAAVIHWIDGSDSGTQSDYVSADGSGTTPSAGSHSPLVSQFYSCGYAKTPVSSFTVGSGWTSVDKQDEGTAVDCSVQYQVAASGTVTGDASVGSATWAAVMVRFFPDPIVVGTGQADGTSTGGATGTMALAATGTPAGAATAGATGTMALSATGAPAGASGASGSETMVHGPSPTIDAVSTAGAVPRLMAVGEGQSDAVSTAGGEATAFAAHAAQGIPEAHSSAAASATVYSIEEGTGAPAAVSTVAGDGEVIHGATGTPAGVSTAGAVGTMVLAATGAPDGVSTAGAVGYLIVSANGRSTGLSRAGRRGPVPTAYLVPLTPSCPADPQPGFDTEDGCDVDWLAS